MTQQSLTATERETVIGFSDEDQMAYVWTAQRRIITKLKRNPGAELVQEGRIGRSPWAEFRVPDKLVSFRRPVHRKEMTPAQKEAARQRMLNLRN